MQMNVAGLRRNIKNVAHNFSDAVVKVREATSNDPSMPPTALLAEIADLTYNMMSFSEIMSMVWKRLNDHGKNWRHVYKALVLLEYLIKSGSEKVLQQCKENKFAIQTLVDFQYYEEMKDQGVNVRERAKGLMALLSDEEKLKNERAKASKIRERLARPGNGFGSEAVVVGGNWSSVAERPSAEVSREIESARPQTVGEEELQLQLALAMSREEAEQEEQRRKSDDVRLQLALSQSQHELKSSSPPAESSNLLDLLDVNLGAAGPPLAHSPVADPWGLPKRPQVMDPWGGASSAINPPTIDPWASNQRAAAQPPDPWVPARPSAHSPALPAPGLPVRPPVPGAVCDPWTPPRPTSHSPAPPDPWAPPRPTQPLETWAYPEMAAPTDLKEPWRGPPGGILGGVGGGDPWSPTTDHSPMSPPEHIDDFDIITNRDRQANNVNNNGVRSPDVFDLSGLSDNLTDKSAKKTPQAFLGENSALVNLENLVSAPKPVAPIQSAFVANPFGLGGAAAPVPAQNLFQQQVPPRPTLNQMSRPDGQSLSPPNPFLS